jgi:2-polyprenyl-3-methyl-5-hydroxy-6-metoxy-1,4-benzoquinol methylase
MGVNAHTAVTLGPSASDQWRNAPEHLAMVLARYRAAAALIGGARMVAEFGCGEGIGAGILASGCQRYRGFDVDVAAIECARQNTPGDVCIFHTLDVLDLGADLVRGAFDAVVALDVIEHLSADDGARLIEVATTILRPPGILVLGTPSRNFDHLASEQSKTAHRHTWYPSELEHLLACTFHVVQSFGMQDMALHLGHPAARHYLLLAGIMPR